jgi:Ca2+/Na+ antiporter
MSGWLRQIALMAKVRTGFGPHFVIWLLIALGSLAAAIGFFCVAAFVWLANRYDAVAAGLILGGVFLLVATISAVACLIARLRTIGRARRELAARSNASWFDPKFVAIGIEIGRALGWRRLITLAAVGLFAAGLGREWSGQDEKTGGDDIEAGD